MNAANSLPRVLGFTTATAVVVGTVIGSGVFKKATAVANLVPDFTLAMLAWVVVGVLTLLGALTLAEVAVIVPKAGGNYAILRDAYGRWAGFLWGWVEFWIIRSASIAALATIFTESLHDILRQVALADAPSEIIGPLGRSAITAGVIILLGLINARGTKWGGGLQVAVTAVKVASLIGLALLPYLVALAGRTPAPMETIVSADAPAKAITLSGFLGALVGVFWAYNGWMNIAPIAGEVRNPQRNIPLAVICGVLILILLYLSVNIGYHQIISIQDIAALKRPVAGEYSFRLLGPIGLVLASGAIMVSVFGALNGNILVGPRLLFAMGEDRLAPKWLSGLHPRYQTPARAELILTAWCVIQVSVVALMLQVTIPVIDCLGVSVDLNLPPGKDPFDIITDFAMFGAISFETIAVASIFVFRRRFPKDRVKLAYRCPFYPVLPIVYVLALAAVLVNMFTTQRAESLTGVGFIAVGGLVYLLFLRRPGKDAVPAANP